MSSEKDELTVADEQNDADQMTVAHEPTRKANMPNPANEVLPRAPLSNPV